MKQTTNRKKSSRMKGKAVKQPRYTSKSDNLKPAQPKRDPGPLPGSFRTQRMVSTDEGKPILDINQVPTLGPLQGKPKTEVKLARRLIMLKKYVEGKTPDIISYEMQQPLHYVVSEIDQALDHLVTDQARATPGQVWAKYTVFQYNVIKKLNHVHHESLQHQQGKGLTAAVSALRAQSDIMDKIINKGTDLGVITKPINAGPAATQLLNLSKDAIKELLVDELQRSMTLLDNLDPDQVPIRVRRKKLGDRDQIIEQEPPDDSWMFKPEHRDPKNMKPEEVEAKKELRKQDQLAKTLEDNTETFLIKPKS